MAHFSTVLLMGNNQANIGDTLRALYRYLAEKGMRVLLDRSCKHFFKTHSGVFTHISKLGECDLAIVVGGDGTLLHAARALAPRRIPLVGINQGRLGFLVDIRPDEMLEKLDEILNGQYYEEERFLLESRFKRGAADESKHYALNDVVIANYREIRMIEFSTIINDHIINYDRADGIIVATPTGSTAYALSSGGPILHPSLAAIALVPICPHALNHRPLVVDAASRIEIEIDAQCQTKAQATFDGNDSIKLEAGDRVEITRSQTTVRLIHPQNYNFYTLLRAKLNWGKSLTDKS